MVTTPFRFISCHPEISFSSTFSTWDTECYPYIAVIISLSPATKVSALPRLDDVKTLNVALLNVTCSPDTVAVAYAVTTDVLLPAVEPDTVCVPSDVGIMACCPRPKAMITTARFLRPGTVTVPFKVIPGLDKTRDTESQLRHS